MQITEVEAFPVSIQLEEPVSFSTRTITERDHAICYVRTDEGHEGLGYTLGYGGARVIANAVSDMIAPIVEGDDPRDTERLWREMFDGNVQVGRKGVLVRAISIVDLALWDVRAKAADLPLYKLLGTNSESVPAYASGGYYREGKGTKGLREEMRTYLDRGHDVVKMKTGRLGLEAEAERVAAARDEIGDHRTLLIDANNAWSTEKEAVDFCRAFEPYDPYFIEEPVNPDSVELMAEVNDMLSYPVAAGELEFSRYGFVQLLEAGAVDIIQPDVTVVGGVTEWMKVAHMAACYDIPVAPHYNWDFHAQLLAAVENGLWAEYFYRDSDVKVFDDIIEEPLVPDDDAVLHLPDRPGHGVTLDQDMLEDVRI